MSKYIWGRICLGAWNFMLGSYNTIFGIYTNNWDFAVVGILGLLLGGAAFIVSVRPKLDIASVFD